MSCCVFVRVRERGSRIAQEPRFSCKCSVQNSVQDVVFPWTEILLFSQRCCHPQLSACRMCRHYDSDRPTFSPQNLTWLTWSDPLPAAGLSPGNTPFQLASRREHGPGGRNSAARAENNSAVMFVLAKLFSSSSVGSSFSSCAQVKNASEGRRSLSPTFV